MADPPKYDLNDLNCALFTREMLGSVGVDVDHSVGNELTPLGMATDIALAQFGERLQKWLSYVGDLLKDRLSDVIDWLDDLFDQAQHMCSPLILDLDGDGVETRNLLEGAHFDHDGNGFAEQTGWVGSDDGLLVLDRNANGLIDNGSELFGNNTPLAGGGTAENGFSALTDLDGNHDGKVDAADSAFAQLRVWRDADSDAIVDAGELLTLNAAGVLSLETAYTQQELIDEEGNHHRQIGSYTATNGTAKGMDDVWFVDDRARAFNPTTTEVSSDIAILPDVAGFGDVQSLHQAMAEDTSNHLKDLVTAYVNESDSVARAAMLDTLIYAWTGVENVAVDSRGSYFPDARKLEALEEFMGRDFVVGSGIGVGTTTPYPQATEKLLEAYDRLAQYITGKLSAQTDMGALYGSLSVEWAEDGNTFAWKVDGTVALLQAAYANNSLQGLQLMKDFAVTLSTTFGGDIIEALRGLGNSSGQGFLYELSVFGFDQILSGTADADELDGNYGNDKLVGGSGNDNLTGSRGNDVFYGGAGDDVMFGGRGDDTFVVERSSALENDFIYKLNTLIHGAADWELPLPHETDALMLGSGILPGDIRIAETDEHGTYIDIVDPTGTNSRTNRIYVGSAQEGISIDLVRFKDDPNTVLTRADIEAASVIGNDGSNEIFGYTDSDVMRGNGGDDTLVGNMGNDDITGGQGDDQLYGEIGDDTYHFGVGQGSDELYDSEGANRIVLDAGIAPSQVKLYRTSSIGRLDNYYYFEQHTADDLVLVVNDGMDQIRVENFFNSPNPNAVSQIVFADGTIWNSATIQANLIDMSGAVSNFSGTTGNDLYSVDHRQDTIVESVGGGVDTVTATVSYTLSANVENLTLTGPLNLNGTGNNLNNVIIGNDQANHLDGQGGSDTLIGGRGDDVYYTSGLVVVDDTVIELAGEGYDTMVLGGAPPVVLPANVERLVLLAQPNASTTLTGNALDNVIDASAAGSSAGTLLIDGGAGADQMIGRWAGPDRFVVDNVGDVVRDTHIDGWDVGRDVIATSVTYTLPEDIEDIELTGTAAISGTGNSHDNHLDGRQNTAANQLIGGLGNDTYYLGSGDTYVETTGGGSDTLMLTAPAGNLGNIYDVSDYPNIENLTATDAALETTLRGDVGNNRLTGNASLNHLMGGLGDDVLVGGDGLDFYEGFGSNSGHDVIEDSDVYFRSITFDSSENISIDQLQFSRDGDDLTISISPQSSIRTESWFVGSSNKISNLTIYNQGLSFNYDSDQIEKRALGINSAPRFSDYLNSYYLTSANQSFSLQLGANVFSDIESQDSLSYSAQLDDGSALPTWLSFDPLTRTFSGTPSNADRGNLSLRVVATDPQGLSGSIDFTLHITPPAILGTAGDDVLTGNNNDNFIEGFAGNDTIDGQGGNDELQGDDGNDAISGGSGADLLDGGAGNDSLDGGTGGDEMYGGTGNDTYSVDDVGDVLWEEFDEGIDEIQSSITSVLDEDVVGEVENLTLLGSAGINGTGNAFDNVLTGNSGNNTLTGLDGNDTLSAGSAGTDSLLGGLGNDIYLIDRSSGISITENSSEGIDEVRSSVTYTLGNNLENLTLTGSFAINGTGNSLANVITGNIANNALSGGTGADTLIGGAGNDTYTVDNTSDVVMELTSEGIDVVNSSVTYTLSNDVESLTLTGSSTLSGTGNALDNVLTGNSGNNTLTGLGGNDTLDAGSAGTDVLLGGLGNDTYVIGRTTGITVTENASEGTDLVNASVTYTLGNNLENLALTGSTAINGTGNTLDNVLTGNSGNNTLTGLGGNDTLDAGSAGTDALLGGTGNDTYIVARTSGITITENASEGTDLVMASVTHTLTTNVENLTLTGTSAINGTGNASVNVITGNSGNNTLDGLAGADTLIGGAGNDTYTVDNTGDIVTEIASEGTDLVNASATYTIGNNVENLTLTGTSAINGTGNTLDNVLTGNSGNNTLTGLAGNDTFDPGSAGTDTLLGGQGNDTYTVTRTTGITITENASEGTDLVNASVAYTLGNNLENLTLTGTSTINGTGNTLDNVLTGNSGSNTLTGLGGNDTFDPGSAGTDVLVGGTGNDTYTVTRTTGITITEAANEGIDSVNASVAHTLAANVDLLFLTGSSAINGTGNALANLLRGNTGNNTLAGAGGTDILEGGDGTDILSNTSGNTLLNGGAGTDTLTGTASNDLLIGGAGNDALTTGSGADLIVFNKGDGQDTVAASTTKDNTLALGGGAVYADLLFQKSGNDLILKVGASDQITFTGYYTSTANHSIDKLQVVIEGTSDYNAGSSDPKLNKKIETFNFDGLVAAFDAARAANPSLTTWALTNALTSQYLSGSDTAAIGGDLSYRYNRFGALSDISFTPALGILGAAGFGTSSQTLQALGSLQDVTPRLS